MNHETLRTLLQTAKGEIAPDAIIKGGRLVNVFTNKIEENVTVLIKDGYVASLEERTPTIHNGTRVIDADGLYLCPGFIDSHTHLDNIVPFHELVPYAIRGGTTAIISETSMVSQSCGLSALHDFIKSTKGYPVRCYFLAPPLTPTFPRLEGAMGMTFRDFSNVLRRDDFLGIGEAYWTRLVEGDDRVLKQAALGISLRKTLEGHSAGARGNKLVQYVVTGITSCHESTTAEEAVEKMRYGVYVMIREGWVRKELREVAGIKDADIDERRVILVSDFFDPVMLVKQGYMDVIVRTAIGFGIAPLSALKMATINAADYFGLRDLGAIAPLRRADILFMEDLTEVSIRHVMAAGEMVYQDGSFLHAVKPYRYPAAVRKTVRAGKLREHDLRVKSRHPEQRVRVVEIANPTITKEFVATLRSVEGYIEKDVGSDIVPAAVINRNDERKIGKGFLRGTGIKQGAFATTVLWDTCNILVTGSSEKEMAKAVNRLIQLQGGVVIVKNGEVIYEFPMPVYGLIPPYGMEEIKEKTSALNGKMMEIGSALEKPFLTLQTMAFTGLPFLRLTDKGIADIKNRKLVPLIVE